MECPTCATHSKSSDVDDANDLENDYTNEGPADVASHSSLGAAAPREHHQSVEQYGIQYHEQHNSHGDSVQSDNLLVDDENLSPQSDSDVDGEAAEFIEEPDVEDIDEESMTNFASDNKSSTLDSASDVVFQVNIEELSGTSNDQDTVEVQQPESFLANDVQIPAADPDDGLLQLQSVTSHHLHGHRPHQQPNEQQHHAVFQHQSAGLEYEQQPQQPQQHHHHHNHRLRCWDYESHERQCLNEGRCFAVKLHNGFRRTGCR